MMRFFLQAGSSLAVVIIGYQLVSQLEDEEAYFPHGKKRIAAILAVLYLLLAVVCDVTAGNEYMWFRGLLWASMALAAYCDYCTTYIYDFVYGPALIGGIMLLTFVPTISWADLLIFIVIQWTLFCRLFGISDCIAFSICALWMALDGGKLFDFSMLMMVAWLGLAVVQFFRRNINKQGNLKEEVAMLPYIAVSMLLLTMIGR